MIRLRMNSMEKQKVTSLEYLMPVFRERLSAGQSVRFMPQGTSMLPMIRQGIDSVVISALPEKLKKYDIPLYQRENGQYVLHRIVEVGDTYTCVGDNQFVLERGLKSEQMIAVVTSFSRGDREYSTNALSYRVCCRVWEHSRHLRYLHRCQKKSGEGFVRFWGVRGVRWIRRRVGRLKKTGSN